MFIGNIIFIALIILQHIAFFFLFPKMNLKSWEGLIPVYNFIRLSRVIKKPWYWGVAVVFPGINLLMFGVYGFWTARCFNRTSSGDMFLACVLPYIFWFKLSFDKTAKFVGPDKFIPEPSEFIKKWVDPILYAVIVVSILRSYCIEAFTIPTSSLEKTLMVGDFLFVNKFAYGPKIPQTPVAFPFAHHSFPGTKTQAYLEWIKLPYLRLPGFGEVERGDITVFNYPDGDTVILNMQDISYYNAVRIIANLMKQEARSMGDTSKSDAYFQSKAWEYMHNPDNINPLNEQPMGKIVGRPVDKREFYVKRTVAIAGDTFQIKDGVIFINGKPQEFPENVQHFYYVKTIGKVFGDVVRYKSGRYGLSAAEILDKYDIYVTECDVAAESRDTMLYRLNMTRKTAEEIKKIPGVVSVQRKIDKAGQREITIFPHHPSYPWNNDNFGPLWLPKKGATIALDTHNLPLYRKIIDTYDDGIHQIEVKGDKIFYDGKQITSYTFKQDYYFLMGDNRHNSADSRSWGMVPFDHVVGSPFFIWLSVKYEENNPVSGKSFLSIFKNSKEGKYRWDRVFSYVEKGRLHSVKIPVISLIIAYIVYEQWKKRKLKKEQKK